MGSCIHEVQEIGNPREGLFTRPTARGLAGRKKNVRLRERPLGGPPLKKKWGRPVAIFGGSPPHGEAYLARNGFVVENGKKSLSNDSFPNS